MNQSSLTRRAALVGVVAAGLVATVLFVGSGLAQQQSGQGGGGFLSNFTGTVSVLDSSEMRMSRIRFEAGARTNWHVHSHPQLIVFEEGRGFVQEMGGPVHELEPGQPYYTQAGVPHWHGASPQEAAVQLSAYTGTLEWMEPVTDEQYRGEAGR